MFEPHTTGHFHLPDGWLIRVDFISGHWCASKITPALHVHAEVMGDDEYVHSVARAWMLGQAAPSS